MNSNLFPHFNALMSKKLKYIDVSFLIPKEGSS